MRQDLHKTKQPSYLNIHVSKAHFLIIRHSSVRPSPSSNIIVPLSNTQATIASRIALLVLQDSLEVHPFRGRKIAGANDLPRLFYLRCRTSHRQDSSKYFEASLAENS